MMNYLCFSGMSMNINNNVDSPKPDPDYIKVSKDKFSTYKFKLNQSKLYG